MLALSPLTPVPIPPVSSELALSVSDQAAMLCMLLRLLSLRYTASRGELENEPPRRAGATASSSRSTHPRHPGVQRGAQELASSLYTHDLGYASFYDTMGLLEEGTTHSQESTKDVESARTLSQELTHVAGGGGAVNDIKRSDWFDTQATL